MTIAEAILRAKDSGMAVECQLKSHSKTAEDGLRIGLHVHRDGIPQELRDAKIGRRFAVVFFPIEDDETLTPQKGSVTGPREGNDLGSLHEQGKAAGPGLVSRPTSLVQQAGALCADSDFWAYLEARWRARDVNDKESAAGYLRQFCRVKSRTEIIEGSAAAETFKDIVEEFHSWRDRAGVEHVEPAF